MKSKIFQILIFLAILAYLLYGFDISKIDFSIFKISGIALTTISLFLSQVLLAFRWMSMSNLSFKISLETIIVSSVLNIILPARLGELSKAFYLKKFYGYNYHKTLSIIFIERFFDIIMLLLIMFLWAYLFFIDRNVKISIIILSLLVIFTILFFNSNFILRLLKKIPLQFIRVYSQKIYKNINRLLKTPYMILFYTLIIWLFYLISYILFFIYSVDFRLDFQEILELFIFSTIALSLPLTPAGVGTFEGAIVLFLTHHGISKENALISATLYHIIIFAVDFAMFYIFLIFKNIKFEELVQK